MTSEPLDTDDRHFLRASQDWFAIQRPEPTVCMIGEPGYVYSWLIIGSERDLLLDTGCGIADIAAAATSISGKPGLPLVVNSHMHFDHVGGNGLFPEVAAHESAPERILPGSEPGLIEEFNELAAMAREGYERLLAVDRDTEAYILGPGEEVRPWPGRDEIQRHAWPGMPAHPDRLLRNGQRLELGDRSLTVLHTPGHATEHICLLDETAGILFAQDQAYYGPQLLHLDGSDVAAYARSARWLADEIAPAVRAVYVAHCLRPAVPPTLLGELADGAEQVAAGEALLERHSGFPPEIRVADFGHFSFVVRS